MFRSQHVPHRGDDLRDFAKWRIWILSFDGGLSVTEEQGVSWDGPGEDKKERKERVNDVIIVTLRDS